jgi:hypothetical protein
MEERVTMYVTAIRWMALRDPSSVALSLSAFIEYQIKAT